MKRFPRLREPDEMLSPNEATYGRREFPAAQGFSTAGRL